LRALTRRPAHVEVPVGTGRQLAHDGRSVGVPAQSARVLAAREEHGAVVGAPRHTQNATRVPVQGLGRRVRVTEVPHLQDGCAVVVRRHNHLSNVRGKHACLLLKINVCIHLVVCVCVCVYVHVYTIYTISLFIPLSRTSAAHVSNYTRSLGPHVPLDACV
jgi:hypothetical protein